MHNDEGRGSWVVVCVRVLAAWLRDARSFWVSNFCSGTRAATQELALQGSMVGMFEAITE